MKAKDYENLKVGEWATDCFKAFPSIKDTGDTFLILKIGESSVDTDEGVGYYNAFFDDSHFDHVDYHCRPATRGEIELACEKLYNED